MLKFESKYQYLSLLVWVEFSWLYSEREQSAIREAVCVTTSRPTAALLTLKNDFHLPDRLLSLWNNIFCVCFHYSKKSTLSHFLSSLNYFVFLSLFFVLFFSPREKFSNRRIYRNDLMLFRVVMEVIYTQKRSVMQMNCTWCIEYKILLVNTLKTHFFLAFCIESLADNISDIVYWGIQNSLLTSAAQLVGPKWLGLLLTLSDFNGS